MEMKEIGAQAKSWIERDERLMSSSYTREYPLVVDKAEGSLLWDVDGRRYIDFMAGIGVMNVGHRHPYVVESVREQVDKFWHICLSDFYYPSAVELAERLEKIAPFEEMPRFYFGNSGTEAVEAAAKLAMVHTKRTKFVSFLGGFHGRTMGSLSFTASKTVQSARYPRALNVFHVPFPNPYRPRLVGERGHATVSYIREELFRVQVDPGDVAAILVEPIQGEGGYIVPPSEFMPSLRELCDEHGILLIVDEIQSGVGRTGRWWAVEHNDVEPDIVCFAKGIASGMPLGGIMARNSVMSWKPGSHGSTFGGNPVAMAAATATLKVIEEENLLEHATKMGDLIMKKCRNLQEEYPQIGDVRGRGLMIGLEIIKGPESKKRDPKLRNKLVQTAFENGLLTLPCGESTLRFIPPLNTSQELVEEGLEKFAKSLAMVTREAAPA